MRRHQPAGSVAGPWQAREQALRRQQVPPPKAAAVSQWSIGDIVCYGPSFPGSPRIMRSLVRSASLRS